MSRSSEFAIEVLGSVGSISPGNEMLGKISIGDFSETFRMSASFWGPREYRRSWRRSLERLVSQEAVDSCLVSSITDPAATNFISCWPLYRRADEVFIQQSIIFLDDLDVRFNPEQPWLSIGPRLTVNEDGDVISEWATTVSEISAFLRATSSP